MAEEEQILVMSEISTPTAQSRDLARYMCGITAPGFYNVRLYDVLTENDETFQCLIALPQSSDTALEDSKGFQAALLSRLNKKVVVIDRGALGIQITALPDAERHQKGRVQVSNKQDGAKEIGQFLRTAGYTFS